MEQFFVFNHVDGSTDYYHVWFNGKRWCLNHTWTFKGIKRLYHNRLHTFSDEMLVYYFIAINACDIRRDS